jgi:hypothetical protein
VPFVEALESSAGSGDDLVTAWSAAADIADDAATQTATLMPKIGRARPHAEKSVGTPDPGAVSLALIIRAVLPALGGAGSTHDTP